MNLLRKNSTFGLMIIILFVIGLFAFVGRAYANPSQFVGTTQTATASSSVIFMTPGNATTTLVADTYQNSSTAQNNYVNNLTELLLQFTASSTASKLNVNIEYSTGYANGNAVDCLANAAGCDWYEESITNLSSFATTSLPIVGIAQVPQYQWGFASSSVGGLTAPTTNRATRAIKLNVPTRYVRAVFTCGAGGAGCGVWAQIVPVKETK